ncbi:hypothetical protein P3L10_011911 [Capsicum annuum]
MIYPFCKFNDCGFTLTELTEIVNNDDDVQGELDSDEPSQYESSDDDQSSDDDDDDNNNDENINGESTSVGVYTDNHSSIAIPYLDHTEESPEELRCMVNEDYFRTPLWNQNNSEHIKSGMLFNNKKQMKSVVRKYNLITGTKFICGRSKRDSWKVICKQYLSGCEWMIHFSAVSSGM